MQKLLFISICICFTAVVSAQFVTEGYLRRAPALPKDSCNITKAKSDSFIGQVDILREEVKNAIGQMNRGSRQSAKVNEATAKQQAAQQMAQFGMSQEDMAKMKSGKMTADEKKALANKMMMQQTNISVDEMKATKGMTAEGEKAYSEALTTEMMASGQAGQIKSSAPGNTPALASLVQEQQQIMGNLDPVPEDSPALYSSLENDAEGQQMLNGLQTGRVNGVRWWELMQDRGNKWIHSRC